MSHPKKSDTFEKSPERKFRRRYVSKRQRRLCRVIEVCAVMMGIILFSHLIEISRKGPAVPRQKTEVRQQLTHEERVATVVTQQVALVPEPRAAVLVLLGLATICYSRRQKIAATRVDVTAINFQPSKMATAAA
jgi:hypothetical protein